MLNGPTYPYLVRDLQVTGEVYDELSASMEQSLMVRNENSLKGKSIVEMGLKKFEEVEIMSVVIGVDVIITQKTIAKLLKVTNTRRYILNIKENSTEAESIKRCLFERSRNMCFSDFGKVENMKRNLKLMFKILIGCLIHREGSTDQISQDHKHFIFYLVNKDKINLLAYIFHHLCEATKDSINHLKKNVPYGRLLSELFYRGRLIDALKSTLDIEDLEEIHENIILAFVLDKMKLLKKSEVVVSKYPLKVRCKNHDQLEDYPIITKLDNLNVIRLYIQQEFEEGVTLRYKELPNDLAEMYKYSKKTKKVASDNQKEVQKPSKKKNEIKKEVEEVIASTVLIPYKTRNGRTPQKESSSTVSYDAPIRKKKLRKMVVFYEIKEEKQEEDVEVSLMRRKMNANAGVQKSVVEPGFRGAQLLASALLEHAEKQPETSYAMLEETVFDKYVLEIVEVQVAKVILGLKTAEVEASGVPKEVVFRSYC